MIAANSLQDRSLTRDTAFQEVTTFRIGLFLYKSERRVASFRFLYRIKNSALLIAAETEFHAFQSLGLPYVLKLYYAIGIPLPKQEFSDTSQHVSCLPDIISNCLLC